MRNSTNQIVLLIAALITGVGLFSQTNRKITFTDVIQYNDFIIDILNPLGDEYEILMEAENQTALKPLLDTFAVHTQKYVDQLTRLQPWKGDNTFRDASLAYVKHYDQMAKKEIPEYFWITFGNQSESEKNKERLKELTLIMNDEKDKLFDNVDQTQQTFAEKFNYKIAR